MLQPPSHRRAVISGLREFADDLSMHRDIPVPLIIEIDYFPRAATDAEKRAEIDRIAKVLGIEPEFTAGGEHYAATRRYGVVHYKAVTISRDALRRWDALMSYSHSVTPDEEPPISPHDD